MISSPVRSVGKKYDGQTVLGKFVADPRLVSTLPSSTDMEPCGTPAHFLEEPLIQPLPLSPFIKSL